MLNRQNHTCLNHKIYIYTHTPHTRDTSRDCQTLRDRAREMDNFFLDSVCQEEDNFWDLIADDISGYDDKSVSVPNKSAFRSYVKGTEQMVMSSSSKVNMNKRMVNLLRKNWEEKKKAVAPEKERCRRHMMKERTRREKQKQSYLALHSLLPLPTKVLHYLIVPICIKR